MDVARSLAEDFAKLPVSPQEGGRMDFRASTTTRSPFHVSQTFLSCAAQHAAASAGDVCGSGPVPLLLLPKTESLLAVHLEMRNSRLDVRLNMLGPGRKTEFLYKALLS